MREVNLERLENRNVRATFEDGLWDVFIGYVMLQMAILPLNHGPGWGDLWSAAIWLPVYALVYWGILRIKERIILPRMGRVRLRPSPGSRLGKGPSLPGFLILLNLAAGVGAFALKPGDWLFPASLAVFFAGAFLVAGFLLGIRRLAFYGLAASAAVLIGEWLHRSYGISHRGLPLALGVFGALVILGGVARLVWFVKTHPRSGR